MLVDVMTSHARRALLTATIAGLLTAIAANAQTQDKPGLWQVETTMTWQKAPLPPEVLKQAQAMPNSPFNSDTKIRTRVCVTQAILDKFGSPEPELQTGCMLLDLKKTPTETSANMACQGHVNGSGNFKVTRTDADHTVSDVHFAGSLDDIQAEWTMHASSTFVSAACGDVQPGKPEIMK